MYEALIVTLLRRMGGGISLPVGEIADASRCRLFVRANEKRDAVEIMFQEPQRRRRRRPS
jgi:hypothetical protein